MDAEYHMPETKRATTDMSRFTVVKGTKGSNYSDQLDQFLDRLNPSRVSAGYKPYTHSRIGRMLKLAGYKAGDLHRLYKECDQANSFSKLFHWKMKQRV